MHRKIASYVTFAGKCFKLLSEDKLLFCSFLVLSVVGALTEGVTVSLLVPILQSQGNPGGFSNIPLLGHMAALFDGLSAADRIKLVAVIMALVLLVRGALQYSIDALGYVIPVRLQKQMIMQNYRLMMGINISYINNNDFGKLLNDISGWSARVSLLLTHFSSLIWSSLVVIVYMAIMVSVSWRLTLTAMLFILAVSILLRRFSAGPLRRAGERLNQAYGHMNQISMESLTGMKLIRLSAAEQLMTATFDKRLDAALNDQQRLSLINAFSSPFLSTSAGIFICFLLFASAVVHENDPNAWVGSILIFLFLLFRLLGPVNQINNARGRITGEMPAFEAQETFRRTATEMRQSTGHLPIDRLNGDIVFDQVDFSYDSENTPVLKGVSLRIPKGKMTAVVGPSGAGKTTLTALLTRLYDPSSGRILIGGTDLAELNLQQWRRRLAVVSQDIFIFNDSVANNLRFGRGDLPLEKLREAARLAAAAEFIEKLPQGYDTLLGDRGVRLSGGQQQRIAIARAILAEPDLLILDEATSHLDTFTERAIQSAVEHLAKDRTLLVIAHRLSTIRRADKVIVLSNGELAEEGRHEELLARRGIYWEMVEHQRLDLVDETQPEGTQS